MNGKALPAPAITTEEIFKLCIRAFANGDSYTVKQAKAAAGGDEAARDALAWHLHDLREIGAADGI